MQLVAPYAAGGSLCSWWLRMQLLAPYAAGGSICSWWLCMQLVALYAAGGSVCSWWLRVGAVFLLLLVLLVWIADMLTTYSCDVVVIACGHKYPVSA